MMFGNSLMGKRSKDRCFRWNSCVDRSLLKSRSRDVQSLHTLNPLGRIQGNKICLGLTVVCYRVIFYAAYLPLSQSI